MLNLSLGAGLACEAIHTASQHRETARKALEDYASFAAFILASRTYRLVGGDVVETFANWPARGEPALPAGVHCSEGASWFEQPPGESIRARGPALNPASFSRLVDTLQNAMPLLEEVGWRFRFVRLPSAGVDGWFITSYGANGGYGVRGFAGCLDGDSSAVRQVMQTERALPPSVTGELPADSLFSVTVASAGGSPLDT